jgi:hypothetical protein
MPATPLASGPPPGFYPPHGGDPVSGGAPYAAQSGSPRDTYYPTSGGPPGDTRYPAQNPPDFTAATFSGRRIEPSPPPERNRLLIGLVAGLTTGLLLFGAGGWFVGHSTAHKSAATSTTPAPPKATLGAYENSQQALNQPHFEGTGLTNISQGWLPYLSDCVRNGEPAGPTLNATEKVRVRCALNGMSVIFVEYDSTSDRDKARVKTLGQNVDARTLTPGAGDAQVRATPSGRTNGNYVEYAYSLKEGGRTRPIAGIWWDDTNTPVAAYLLAFWKEGVGESWAPMRDLWSRYA